MHASKRLKGQAFSSKATEQIVIDYGMTSKEPCVFMKHGPA